MKKYVLFGLVMVFLASAVCAVDTVIWDVEEQQGDTTPINSNGVATYTLIQQILATSINDSATTIKIILKGFSDGGDGMDYDKVSICEQSGTSGDCVDAPEPVLYGTGRDWGCTDINGKTSDELTYTIDSSKNYLVRFYTANSACDDAPQWNAAANGNRGASTSDNVDTQTIPLAALTTAGRTEGVFQIIKVDGGGGGPIADNQTVDANFTSSYTQLGSPIPPIHALINMTNANETTNCDVLTNNTAVTCGSLSFSAGNSTDTSVCSITAVMETSVSAQVNCSGLTTPQFNASIYTFSLDTNSNPTVTLNISTGYAIPDTGSFDLLISKTDWVENSTCKIDINISEVVCSELDNTWDSSVATYTLTHPSWNTTVGSFNGAFPGWRASDYDFATQAIHNGANAYVYWNYTSKDWMRAADWFVRDRDGAGPTDHNISVPSDCFDYADNYLGFRAISSPTSPYVDWQCYGTTGWTSLLTNPTDAYIYEQILYYYSSNYTNADATFRCVVTGDIEESFEATANCTGSTLYGVETNTNSSWVDIINPYVAAKSFAGGNGSFWYGGNITGNVTFTDSNLWKINVTLDGSTIYTTQDINLTSYTYNLDYPVDGLGVGTHTLTFGMWDSHTKQELQDDWGVSRTLTGADLTFRTDKNSIKIYVEDDTSLFNPFSFKKLKDRYTFTYEPKDSKKSNYVYYVHTEEPLQIVNRPESKWKEWLVSGNNWVDFYTGDPEAKVKIKLLDAYTAEVTVSGLKNPKKQEFQSVGELNYAEVSYTFYTYDVSVGYQLVAGEQQTQDTYLYVNFSTTPPAYNSSLLYNGTQYTPTYSVSGNDLTLKATYLTPTISGISDIITGTWQFNMSIQNHTFDFNNTVYDVKLDDCSFANATAISVTIYNEDVPYKNETGSLAVVFDYTYGGALLNASYNKTGDSVYHFCLFPAEYVVYVDAYFLYSVAGGFTHRYYLNNQTITNTTLDLSVFNYNDTTGKSNLKGTVRHENTYQYYTDAYSALQRFYPGENVWRTVQMDKSGDFGLIFYNVREEDTDYRVRFYDGSANVLRTTDRLKFVCDSGVCDLTFLISDIPTGGAANNLIVNSTYDNTTGIINVWWDDSTGFTTEVRSIVSKDNMGGTTTICDQTSAGAAGNITCNVSLYSGTFKVSVIAAHSPRVIEFIKYYSGTTALVGSVLGSVAETSIWSYGIFITVIGFGVASPVAAIVASIFALISLYFLGMLTGLSITFLVVAAIVGIVIGIKVRR